MHIERLNDLTGEMELRADVIVIGGGPTGITIAKELARSGTEVLLLESGLQAETSAHAALNKVENVGELQDAAQIEKRSHFHGLNSKTWSRETQAFGVRCRALGGSTHAWAGKSAPFDPIDFAERDWVPNSGWPFGRGDLDPFIRRAMEELNLCPTNPDVSFESEELRSFFWQFARSRIDGMDVMRFGNDLIGQRIDKLRVLLDATVTNIALDETGNHFSHVNVASVGGGRRRIAARFCVLAASGIENPRLLLSSRDQHSNGIGNAADQVGRYLMDHPSAQIGTIAARGMASVAKRFGFYGVQHDARAHMFMHGLAITPETQQREKLLNAAVYFTPMRSPDDPLDAMKRLACGRSKQPGRDLMSVTTGAGWLAKAVGMKILASDRTPKALKDFVINAAIRVNPNLVADEFQTQGVQHKMTGLAIDAITEQRPNRDSRVSLGSAVDQFGVPIARIDWRINQDERRTLRRIAELTCASLKASSLPSPILENWVEQGDRGHAVIIDMGHTLGTTRMGIGPKRSVVDQDCKVHGVNGLYVAGGSVFPTSGHANPTLMILAVAIRLGDHLKFKLAKV